MEGCLNRFKGSFLSLLSLAVLFQHVDANASNIETKIVALRGSHQAIVNLQLDPVELKSVVHESKKFDSVQIKDLNNLSGLHHAALPFYSIVVRARAEDLAVNISAPQRARQIMTVNTVLPAQKEPCRCPDDRVRKFEYSAKDYKVPTGFYEIQKLGDFRGEPISRVLFYPVQYDTKNGALSVYRDFKATVGLKPSASKVSHQQFKFAEGVFQIPRSDDFDYLVVTKKKFSTALRGWYEHKRKRQGLRFTEVYVDGFEKDSARVGDFIRKELAKKSYRFALIVGSQDEITTDFAYTSGDSQTPTDLPYFTLGGEGDHIPEVFAGRLVADSADEVELQIKKWMQYENDQLARGSAGWTRGIGVASNEGSSPSDDEYVKSIEAKFKQAAGTQFTHFYQNDKNSNPTKFNEAMLPGAAWVTYLGHGSGTSWPSFYQTYYTSNIKDLKNTIPVRPIWIDVACQNGGLQNRYAGERMMNESENSGSPIGTVAFYGGTVNISWHPPAILARGIAFKMLDQSEELRVLGPAIQMGHMYLAENYSDEEELAFNQRWYHLQGDPSLQVRLK